MAPLENAALIRLFGVVARNQFSKWPIKPPSIANPSVIAHRANKSVGGKPLLDFVPLYWTIKTPMQYVLPSDNELAFCVFSAAEILSIPGVWSTDGNAANWRSKFYRSDGALEHLDWDIIDKRPAWGREYKRKKMAEILVPNRIPPTYIQRICVKDAAAQSRLREFSVGVLNSLTPAQRKSLGIDPKKLPSIKTDASLYY